MSDYKAKRDKFITENTISDHVNVEFARKCADWARAEAQAEIELTRKMAEALLAEREQEIERLRAQALKLKAALERVAKFQHTEPLHNGDDPSQEAEIARGALANEALGNNE